MSPMPYVQRMEAILFSVFSVENKIANIFWFSHISKNVAPVALVKCSLSDSSKTL